MDPQVPARWAVQVSDLSKFDPVAAHLCAWCTYYSYYDSAPAWYGSVLGALEIKRIPYIESIGRPQGWLFRLPECNIVCFGATTEYSQLYGYIRDTYYRQLEHLPIGALVGNAWATMAESIFADWRDVIASYMTERPTFFTGHSLGAAVAATLHAMMYQVRSGGWQAFGCYTTGCPRVGNRAFANATPNRWNIVHEGDIIPKIPHAGYVRPVSPLAPSEVKSVTPVDPFINDGVLCVQDQGGGLTVNPSGTLLSPAVSPIEWDAANAFIGVANKFGDRQNSGPENVVTKFKEGLAYHKDFRYLSRLAKSLPAEPLPGPSIDSIGYKFEQMLPPEPGSTIADQDVIVPPAYPTPQANPHVVPLRGRRRH